jgi:hypothetical protein
MIILLGIQDTKTNWDILEERVFRGLRLRFATARQVLKVRADTENQLIGPGFQFVS